MTSRERRAFKILYAVVVPVGVLLIDAALLMAMRAWTYNLKDHGAAAFWPIVVMLGALFFPIAAGLFAKSAFDLWSARASTHWRVAEGRVTESTIEIHEYTRRGWIGWDTVQEYLPKVAYAYEVAGSTYTNDLTAFGLSPLESREEAERMLRGYPKGAPVRVHYDPDDPGTSVLQSAGGWALTALGAALLTAAIPFGAAFMMVTHRPL
jgi:uncharacterized protein DUF3592